MRLQSDVQCSNDVFDRALAVDGFSQNRGKEELLHCTGGDWFSGRSTVGAREACVTARQGRHSWRGISDSHLGEKALSSLNELPRRASSHNGAQSVSSWYESQGVVVSLKRCFFISRVVNTALSGIEAFCPSKAERR